MESNIVKGNYKIYHYLIGILIFFMLVFPAQCYVPKITCMGLMYIFMKKKFEISRPVAILIDIFVVFGFWSLIGALIKNTEFPFSSSTVTILWPILLLPFICQKYNPDDFKEVARIIFFAQSFIVLYDLIFCYSVIYGFTIPNLYPTNQVFSFYGNSSRLGFLNLNTITFTSPIIIIIWMAGVDIGIKRYLLFIIILLSLFLMILSGRRSMMGLAIGIMPIIYIFRSFFKKGYRASIAQSFFLILILLCGLLGYVMISYPDLFEGYSKTFVNAFDSSKEPIKFAQSQMLMDEFIANPFTGVGVGKLMYEPSPGRTIYSHEFELQYLLTLAQTGIIGFTLKIVFLTGILTYGIILGKKYNILLLSFSIGFLFILIADFTNPVLCSFDFYISAYLILAFINSILIRNDKKKVMSTYKNISE